MAWKPWKEQKELLHWAISKSQKTSRLSKRDQVRTLCCEKIRNFLWCVIGTLHRLCHPVFSVLPEDYFFALLPFKSWGDHNISLFNSKQRSAYLVRFLLNILTHYPQTSSVEVIFNQSHWWMRILSKASQVRAWRQLCNEKGVKQFPLL